MDLLTDSLDNYSLMIVDYASKLAQAYPDTKPLIIYGRLIKKILEDIHTTTGIDAVQIEMILQNLLDFWNQESEEFLDEIISPDKIFTHFKIFCQQGFLASGKIG